MSYILDNINNPAKNTTLLHTILVHIAYNSMI